MAERTQFLATWEQEFGKTLKVLKAYPADRKDLQPHPKCPGAAELAWRMVFEEKFFAEAVASGKMEFGNNPPTPASFAAIIGEYEQHHRGNVAKIQAMTDEEFRGTMKFFTGPNKMEDVRKADILWLMLHDTIHHRGQFSIYLRMADGKVPSIYGPSGDEPWM